MFCSLLADDIILSGRCHGNKQAPLAGFGIGGKMRRGGGCLAAFGDLDDRLLLGLSSACVCVCVCIHAVVVLLF